MKLMTCSSENLVQSTNRNAQGHRVKLNRV